ncbi:MAG: sigma-70 family RNA polymerase sigma factor [Ignavibacterium sp.]
MDRKNFDFYSNLENLNDEDLIKEFQENDTIRAFEILVYRYKNRLMNFVYRFIGDYETSADIVQETMIKLYKNKNSYKSLAKFSTWIYTIAGNLARTELKNRKRRSGISIDSSGFENEPMDIPDFQNMPDVQTDMVIKEKIIQDALLKVAEVYREAVILRDIQDLSYEEIAKILGITVGTVKSRINRGRAYLKKLLKNIYME